MKKNPCARIAAISMAALLPVGLVGCGDNGEDEVVTVTSVTNTTVNAPDKAGRTLLTTRSILTTRISPTFPWTAPAAPRPSGS